MFSISIKEKWQDRTERSGMKICPRIDSTKWTALLFSIRQHRRVFPPSNKSHFDPMKLKSIVVNSTSVLFPVRIFHFTYTPKTTFAFVDKIIERAEMGEEFNWNNIPFQLYFPSRFPKYYKISRRCDVSVDIGKLTKRLIWGRSDKYLALPPGGATIAIETYYRVIHSRRRLLSKFQLNPTRSFVLTACGNGRLRGFNKNG